MPRSVGPWFGRVVRLIPSCIALPLLLLAGFSAAGAAAETGQRPRILVGSEFDYPPFALVTKDGQPDGYSVDLMKAVCEAMGIDITFRVGPWAEIRRALETGEIDALPLVSYSKERDRVFDFTVPHTIAHGIVFRRKDSPGIDSVSDLRDKTIVVMRADAAHDWLRRNDVSDKLILADTVAESLKMLASGKGDYAVAPRLVGLLTARKLDLSDLEIAGPLIDAYGRGYGFAVKEGNAALLAQLNEGLRIIKANGRYDAIYDKWFGVVDPRGVPTEVIVRDAAWGISGIVLLGGMVFVWIVTLRRTVRRQTLALQTAYADVERKIEERTGELSAEVAERRKAEESLRRSEEQKRLIIETVPDLVWLKDTEGTYLACNRMFERFFGAREEEIVGKTDYDFVDRDLADSFRKHDKAAMDADQPLRNEEWITFADDGHRALLETTKTPLRDGEGSVVGVLGIGRDITERARAEETLRKNETLLSEMGRAAKIGGWEHDLRTKEATWTSETYRIIEIPEGQRPPGPEEHLDYYHPDDRPILAEAYRRAVEDGRPFDLELRCHTATGRPFWCRAIGHPVFENGRCAMLFGAFQDITERKALQQQLAQAQKMEAVGQLTGGLAHDLNNVLGIILLNVGMLAKKVAGFPDAARNMEYIENGIHRAASLVRKLLDYARTEMQEVRRVSVNDFIHEIRGLIEKSLTPAITLKLSLSERPWSVDIDPGDFETSIINLALNARDAMPDGGALVIETANKVIDQGYVDKNPGSSAGEFVMISVSDVGTGMPPEAVARAIEPFFTTKEVGKGTGLGLSMVYSFVQRSGGHMKIYSELGKGTSVHLYLPRAEGAGETMASRPLAKEHAPGGGETILVVDDEEQLVEIAMSMLQSIGYRTLAARNGRQALDILKQDPSVDLLFSDVIMPGGMDGYALAVAALERRPDLKVLLTSGFTRKREELANGDEHIAAELAKHLLHKPYTVDELAAAIREALDRQD